MKLILRKNDSATSLLLFIYNNYLLKTSKDSLKLSSLLDILKVFDKNEAAIRMSLSRAVKAGVLSNSRQGAEVIYSLTQLGRHSIEVWNEGVSSYWKRYRLRNQPWDGKWHFINIDFREGKKQRIEVLDKLQQLGFAIINTNTWICPYHQLEEVKEVTEKYRLENGVVQISGDLTVGKDLDSFIDEVYHLDGLRPKYQEFINKYTDQMLKTREICMKEQFIDGGRALPLLHEFGWEFFKIASNDAVLPKQLYPYWEGDEAASLMQHFRELLLEATWRFLDKYE